jgi:cytosine/adenosine deaminase-related metal-dependent hydrolase
MTDPATDLTSGRLFALSGRVVTMNGAGLVLDRGVVYGRAGSIVDVRPVGDPPPAGFEQVARVATRGTLFPGLIELHNHLPYDVLGLWQVPRRYGNRDQWSGSSTADYHRLITGPMQVLGVDPALVAAIVRYVEVRCLLGGTTTSQGVTLSSAPGIIRHFRGLVRNVESTGDPDLPPAATHIADIDAADAQRFLARISTGQRMILHLAEGTNLPAHNHFAALQFSPNQWAITANLVGIHCVALTDADFAVMAAHGGSMVWSPLSNLLLYGQTSQLGAARARHLPVALGSDWAPSGSKNLLGELKVARLAAPLAGAADVRDEDLVAMATRVPAEMLGWDAHLGSLEAGKRADLHVVAGTAGNPFSRLIDATEADLRLVMIDGIPRMATRALMAHLGASGGTETILVGGRERLLNLTQITADPEVEAISVTEAISRLTRALHDLPTTRSAHPARTVAGAPGTHVRLAVEGLVDNAMTPRPHLPLRGQLTGPNLPATRTLAAARAAVAAAGPLPALSLDPLTAVDNPTFYDTLAGELNLPPSVKDGLTHYRRIHEREG